MRVTDSCTSPDLNVALISCFMGITWYNTGDSPSDKYPTRDGTSETFHEKQSLTQEKSKHGLLLRFLQKLQNKLNLSIYIYIYLYIYIYIHFVVQICSRTY
jgi:hypothetical protein